MLDEAPVTDFPSLPHSSTHTTTLADETKDREFLRAHDIAEGHIPPAPDGSPYQRTLCRIRDHFHKTLEEERRISQEDVEQKYSAARANVGEPVMTSLLQACLEQCERESATRRRDVYQITAGAVRRLRSQSMPARRRRNLRPKATEVLTRWFDAHTASPYPTELQKQKLAETAGIEVEQVSNWFSNRRNRRGKSTGGQ
jgi:hypothetical protein